MKHITDQMIDDMVSIEEAYDVVLDAFSLFGKQQCAMQERVRTESGPFKLSTLGAVIPAQGVAGAKIYSTVSGQFNFVIMLFSTQTGEPLATLDANAITRLRTAASTAVAAKYLARKEATHMVLFGAGVQGQSHAVQFSRRYPLQKITLLDPYVQPGVVQAMQDNCGVPVVLTEDARSVQDADIIITASRSPTALFSGDDVRPGTFIGAIGSSLPHTRELDDRTLEKASLIAIEWQAQTMREAGDLVLAGASTQVCTKLVELGDLVAGHHAGRINNDDITVYKAVGVGIEDIALAGLAYKKLMAR